MQRFLDNYELKDLVCDEISGDKKSLYALTRTCCGFVEPAIDYLWHSIDSFEPLVACLPVNSWREERHRGMFSNRYTIVYPNRPLTRKDLEHYLEHATNIREFRFEHKRQMRFLSPELLASLQAVTGGQLGALSPRLSSFEWAPDIQDRMLTPKVHKQIPLTLLLFVADGVNSLKFLVEKDLDLQPILSTSGRLPGLQSFTLSGDTKTSLEAPLSPFLWSNLETISLTGPSEVALSHVAGLPRLATIHIKYLRNLDLEIDADTVASNPSSFSALRRAFIHGDEIHYAAKFFHYLPSTNSVRLAHCSTSTSSSVEECRLAIDILEQQLNPRTLERLEVLDLENDGSGAFCPAEILVEGEDAFVDEPAIDMPSLFKFGNLKTLVLRVRPGVLVTESEIGRITKNWPGMEHLDLCGTFPNGRRPSIRYHQLLELVDNCKALRVLGLPFDGTNLDVDLEDAHDSGASLKTLRVCGSPIHDVVLMQAVIRRTLPHLKDLDTFYHGWLDVVGGSDSKWYEVSRVWNQTVSAS